METWRLLAGAAMSPGVSLVGVALATNFRGVTEWHVRRSMATASVLRRVPPWRWSSGVLYEKRLARFLLLIGVAFAVVGVMILVGLGNGILAGRPVGGADGEVGSSISTSARLLNIAANAFSS